MKAKKRLLSLLLCGAMLFSLCPQVVSAEGIQDSGKTIGGLCEHHPEHTEDCGYTEGTPGTLCNHEHTDECYTEVTSCVHEHRLDCYPAESVSGNTATPSEADEAEPVCGHVCSEESGCIKGELDCQHEHSEACGYTPATEGTPCGYVCVICKPQDSGPTSGQSVQKPEEETEPDGDACICTGLCSEDNVNPDCPVCRAEGADLTLCKGAEPETATPSEAEKSPVEEVQSLIDELPTADELAAMSLEEQQAVYDKVQAAYEAYNALTDEQKAEVAGAEIFDGLFAVFNGMANTLAEKIQYIVRSWNGSEVTEETKDISDYTEITSTNTPTDWNTENGGYYVVTGEVNLSERVTVTGEVHLILTDNCALTASKGICVNEGNSLTIYATSEGKSMGKLIASAEEANATAGIGGNKECTGGIITIHGGTVTVTGGFCGAGIGGGWGGKGGTITILGGKIDATGVGGAGIGGGMAYSDDHVSDGGIITIYGGDITAKGQDGGAGIGGGSHNYASSSTDILGGNGGTIFIYGGHVKAIGETQSGVMFGAGIGGGSHGNGGTITISGGTVEATSSYGAGIGGGTPSRKKSGGDQIIVGGSGGNITITGGKVTAVSTYGAGIGGARSYSDTIGGVSGGTIRITGGKVTATGGSDAYDIGSGGTNVPSDKIEIGGGATVTTEGTNGIGKSHVADTTKWDKDDTYHWRPCQVENCDKNENDPDHDFLKTKENHTWKDGNVNGSGDLVCTCVCEKEKTYNLQGISVTGPTRLTYNEGEALDLSGLKITASFTGTTETKEIAYPNTDMSFSINNGTQLTTAHNGQTITVTWNNQTAATAALTVNAADAETPNITDHPDNASYTIGDTATHLSVTASVSDGGNLFFQWYSNTANDNTNGTKIDGETGSTYTPPTTAEGTTYYYCVVTNTKGQKSATAVSNTAEIKVSPAAPTEYTVTVNDSYAAASGEGSYEANKTVSINAGSRSNYRFNGWTSSDGISFANAGSPSTTFVMPGKNVTVTANWTYNGGGGGGSTSYDYFTITASAGAGGSISPSGSFSVREGRDKTFTITPDSGYRISDVLIDGKSVGAVNTYTFDNVQKRHTIEAVFAKENPSTGGNPFTDVKESDWFYDDVMFVYGNGLMSGTSATTFEPYTVTTRAQIAAILYRLDGSPAVEGRNNYADVEYGPGTAWYYDAATWAQQSGVMSGYGNNLFGPNDPVTRQQLAVTFYNYAKYKGYDVTAAGDLSGFADAGEISPWAQNAMKWAVGIGLMNGKGGGILDPQGTATRAEVAAMLHNFIERNHLVPPAVAPGGDGGAGGTGNGGGGWTQRTSSPQTGDNTPIWPFVTLPVSAAGLVTCTILYCKRRKEEDEEPACYPA